MKKSDIRIGNGGQWEIVEYEGSDDYAVNEAWSVEQKLEMLRKTINEICKNYEKKD